MVIKFKIFFSFLILFSTSTFAVSINDTVKFKTNGRMSDPVISGILSPDNFVQDETNAQNFNRYSYVINNPLKWTDPSGWLLNPIYDFSGNFLGTDDRGLQGMAIIMDRKNFKQGMSHDEAAWKGEFFSELGPYDRWKFMEKGYPHWQGLSERPDWDGFVTIDEGIAWAKSHPNALKNETADNALYLDASKLDFGKLQAKDMVLL